MSLGVRVCQEDPLSLRGAELGPLGSKRGLLAVRTGAHFRTVRHPPFQSNKYSKAWQVSEKGRVS